MQQQQTTSTAATADGTVTETTTTLNSTHVSSNAQLSSGARNPDSEEPIRLSKFSGGYIPDPTTPRKIESLDWPAPPYPAAVPELRARSRSSSNRRAPSTVTSIRGDHDYDDEEEEEDEDEEMMRHRVDVTNPNQTSQQSAVRQSTGAASVTSSMARAKASRPSSKLNYHNKLFDNDYDDYLLRYRSDKEFRRVLNKSATSGTGTRATRYQSGESSTCEDLNPEMQELCEDNIVDSDEEAAATVSKAMTPKLQKEMEEISKLEHESSMAHAVLSEIKVSCP